MLLLLQKRVLMGTNLALNFSPRVEDVEVRGSHERARNGGRALSCGWQRCGLLGTGGPPHTRLRHGHVFLL